MMREKKYYHKLARINGINTSRERKEQISHYQEWVLLSWHWNFDDSSSSSHSPVSRNKLMITGRRLFCPSTPPFTHPAQHQWTEIEKKIQRISTNNFVSFESTDCDEKFEQKIFKKKEESAHNYSKANVQHRRKEAFMFSNFRIFICKTKRNESTK